MPSRETFLHACTQIAAQLDGFRLLQKGQALKKDLPDKDTVCEIRFQGSRNNCAHNITMLVHLTLSSRQFKQWAQSQSLPNGDASGIFYANQLGYLTPRKDWRHWQLAGASLPHSVRDIVADLQQYALPLCDLFTDKAAAVAYLRQHGSALNPWLDNKNLHSGLFYYAYCCGGSEAAYDFLGHHIRACGYRRRYADLYTALASGQPEASINSDFIGADELRFAYAQGIRFDF